MIPEYIFQATVESVSDKIDVFEGICKSYLGWVDDTFDLKLTVKQFETDGSDEALHSRSGAEVQLHWKCLNSSSMRALKIETTQFDDDREYLITTSVGIVQDSAEVTLRVMVGFDLAPGVLVPKFRATIMAPGFLRKLLNDQRFVLWAFGKQIPPNVVTVDQLDKLNSLQTDLAQSQGLPALVILGLGLDDRRREAERIARNLHGEIRVFLCNSAESFENLISGQRSLRNGECGVLLWQNAQGKVTYLKAIGIETFVRNEIRKSTSRALYRDIRWGQAELAAGAERDEIEKAERTERDRLISSEKNSTKKIILLEQKILELEDKAVQEGKLRIAVEVELEREKVRANELLESHFADEGNFKELLVLQRDNILRITPDAANGLEFPIPPLQLDYMRFFAALVEQSDEAIVFTPNALERWKVAVSKGFFSVPEMERALKSLMKAAMAYRYKDGSLGDRLGDWLGGQFGLTYAPEEDKIKQSGLDNFEFEGKSFSRLGHIKVTDSKAPNDVGRIYFDHDRVGLRFIVDVVGTKLLY